MLQVDGFEKKTIPESIDVINLVTILILIPITKEFARLSQSLFLLSSFSDNRIFQKTHESIRILDSITTFVRP